jgi:hypothetical protein
MPSHNEFNDLGDQWLVAYACTNSNMPIPTLFTIGHCLEAYCKSALLKHDPKLKLTGRNYGHNIESMVSEIKTKIGILKSVFFMPNVEARFMTGGPIPLTDALMSDAEYLHYVPNQELYWTAKFQKELKYIGTSGNGMPVQFGILVMERNPYWVPLLKELRSYLRNGEVYETPTMQSFLSSANYPQFAREFVQRVCN